MKPSREPSPPGGKRVFQACNPEHQGEGWLGGGEVLFYICCHLCCHDASLPGDVGKYEDQSSSKPFFLNIKRLHSKINKKKTNWRDRLGLIGFVYVGNVFKKPVWTEDIDWWSFLFWFLFKQLLSDILGVCTMGQTPKRHITAFTVFESTAYRRGLEATGNGKRKANSSPQEWNEWRQTEKHRGEKRLQSAFQSSTFRSACYQQLDKKLGDQSWNPGTGGWDAETLPDLVFGSPPPPQCQTVHLN